MILSIVIMAALFFVSISVPFLGFLLPTYQLRRFPRWGFRKMFWIHILFFCVLLGIQKELALIYFTFPFLIFLFYSLFFFYQREKGRNVEELIVTALVSTAVLLIFFYFFRSEYKGAYEFALHFWKEKYQLSNSGILQMHYYMSKYYPSMIFHYSMFLTFFTYMTLDGMKKYRYWSLHCLWVLPYAATVFLEFLIPENNFYLSNIQEMSKGILFWYGIQGFYDFFANNFKKYRWILHAFSFFIALEYPNFMFIFGGMITLLDAWDRSQGRYREDYKNL